MRKADVAGAPAGPEPAISDAPMAVAVLASAVPAGSKSALKKTTRFTEDGPNAPPTASKKTRFFDEVPSAPAGVEAALVSQPLTLPAPQVEVPEPSTATKKRG